MNNWHPITEPPKHEKKVMAINNYGAPFIVWYDDLTNEYIHNGTALKFHKGMYLEYWQEIILPDKK